MNTVQKIITVKKCKSFADVIINSIKTEPEAWTLTSYRFINVANGISFWIANDYFAFKIEEFKNKDVTMKAGRLGFIEKRRIWYAFKKWKKERVSTPNIKEQIMKEWKIS